MVTPVRYAIISSSILATPWPTPRNATSSAGAYGGSGPPTYRRSWPRCWRTRQPGAPGGAPARTPRNPGAREAATSSSDPSRATFAGPTTANGFPARRRRLLPCPRPATSHAGPGGHRGPVSRTANAAMADGRARPGIPATGRPGRHPPSERHHDRPVRGVRPRVAAATGRPRHLAYGGQRPLRGIGTTACRRSGSGVVVAGTPRPDPHGLRHGHQNWMDEDRIADVLKSEQMVMKSPACAASTATSATPCGPSSRRHCKSAGQPHSVNELSWRHAQSCLSWMPCWLNKAPRRTRSAPKSLPKSDTDRRG